MLELVYLVVNSIDGEYYAPSSVLSVWLSQEDADGEVARLRASHYPKLFNYGVIRVAVEKQGTDALNGYMS